jgi:broad specificity phosphatase PhoE
MREQFLPLRNKNDGYANCFCAKVTVGPNDQFAGPALVFKGFPDKSKYDYISNDTALGEKKKTGDWDTIMKILKNYLGGTGNTANLYFIRHGNSMHNKPMAQKMADSPLTPAGLYQASYLGALLRAHILQGYTRLYSSYLMRSQQTALQVTFSLLSSDTDTIDAVLPEKLAYMQKIYNYYAFSVCQNVLAKVDKRFQEGLKGPRDSSLDLANHTITTFANFFVKKLWTELANQKPKKQMSEAVWEGFEKMLNFPSTDDSRFVNVLIGVSTSFLSAREIAQANPTDTEEAAKAAAAAASWLEKVSIHFATELKRVLHANILAYVNLSKPDCSSFCVACPTPCTRIGGRRTRRIKHRRRKRKKKKSRKSEVKQKYFGIKKGKVIKLYKHKILKKIGRYNSVISWRTSRKNLPRTTYYGKFYKTRKAAKRMLKC